ncbi:F-box/kelch-repeat protein At3g06240-like [Papaver somniferum]|uniref:F-box/kelch-repeat protein At3g06240-like n=1 Tax=Papaver somniferum TaxID=3469 RepID=UPI000E700A8C|nr:F-box/kelch-repeat protein At3g06240-like [Papaver somniferum]
MDIQDFPRIYGSCDGLVCLAPFFDNICIWNPATREYKKAPEPLARFPHAHGFGFDCKNDDYKVVRIGRAEDSDQTVEGVELFEACVYSLASNSWKNLGIIRYGFSEVSDNGFHLNGVCHWIANTTDERTGTVSAVVVCFDFSDETFYDLPLPKNNSSKGGKLPRWDLGIWEGKLCLLCGNGMGCQVDVWTMTDNKWSKHSSITALIADMNYKSPIQTLQNGEILFLSAHREEYGLHFISYDPKLERPRAMKIHGFSGEDDEVVTYIETLIGLNSGTYVGKKKKNRVPKKKQILMTDMDLES